MAELESSLVITMSKIDMVMEKVGLQDTEKANNRQSNGKSPGTQKWGELWPCCAFFRMKLYSIHTKFWPLIVILPITPKWHFLFWLQQEVWTSRRWCYGKPRASSNLHHWLLDWAIKELKSPHTSWPNVTENINFICHWSKLDQNAYNLNG